MFIYTCVCVCGPAWSLVFWWLIDLWFPQSGVGASGWTENGSSDSHLHHLMCAHCSVCFSVCIYDFLHLEALLHSIWMVGHVMVLVILCHAVFVIEFLHCSVPPSVCFPLICFIHIHMCAHMPAVSVSVWRDVKMCYRASINSCPAPMFFPAHGCPGPETTLVRTNSNITSDSTSSW